MNTKNIMLKIATLTVTLAGLTLSASAETYIKDNNTLSLTDPNSWVSGSVPGAGDIAQWDNTVAANTSALGADWSLGQIKITSPGGKITISAGDLLTLLGVSGTGIDMNGSTQDLEINANVKLGAAQTWFLARSFILGGNLTGSDALTINGTGDITLRGDNSGYTGVLTLATSQEKTLNLNHVNALGKATLNVNQSFVIAANVSDIVINNTINLNNTLKFNTNGRNVELSGVLAGTGAISKTNNAGVLTISGTNTFALNKIELATGEVVVSGSIYSTVGTQIESPNNTTTTTGTLTITGVLDRASNGIRPLSTSSTMTINVKENGIFNTRSGNFNMQYYYQNNQNSVFNLNLSEHGIFTATASTVGIGGKKGMVANLNLSGDSLFHVAALNLNIDNNTTADATAYVNVTIRGNAVFKSNGDINVGYTSDNVRTVIAQSGGTVQAPIVRLNGSTDRVDNQALYYLNGGVLYLSDNNDAATGNHNTNSGNSSISLGKDSAMILNGGTIRVNGANNGINGNANAGTNSGTGRLIVRDGVTFDTIVSGNFSVNVALEHDAAGQAKDGGLQKTGVGTLLLYGANTYTGDTTVSAGKLELINGASLLFKLGADGGINKIYNNGGTVTLNGSIAIDVSDYAAGSSWNLFSGNVTLGNTFTVSGAWQNDGGGMWSLGTDWTFDQSSGLLNVIPEPSTLTLLFIGAGLLTVSAARRRKCER